MSTHYGFHPMQQSPRGYNQYTNMVYQDNYGVNKALQSPSSQLVFRKRLERIDWRKIASVDVEHIARMMDFNALQENITNITFCNIEAELDLRSVDPNFTKLFKLAQLTIEYLLHSQDYLAGVVGSLEDKLRTAQQEHEQVTSKYEQQQKELTEVRKESHKRKKMLAAQQHILHAGSSSYNKCPYCSKAFLNASFLQAHLQRRHGDSACPSQSPQSPARLSTALERELVEIKERLRTTETLLQSERSKTRRELFSEKNVTNVLRETNKENVRDSVQVIDKQELNEEELTEVERMKNLFMAELKEMNEKYQASQNALVQMERQYGRRSHLGELRDDVDVEAELLGQQREELAVMKEKLQQQKSRMDSGVSTKLTKQERKWERKFQNMTADHANELAKLNSALEKSVKTLERNQKQSQQQQHDTHQLLQETKQKERQLKAESNRLVSKEMERPLKKEAPNRAVRDTVVKSSPSRRLPQKFTSINPFPDDDTDDDSEDEDELHSPYGTGNSLGHTAGTTGEMSTQRSNRLMDQLRKDPTILKGMREELEYLLNEKLVNKGIPAGSRGLSTDMLNSKMSVLKTERKALEQRYPGFDEVRKRLSRHVDNVARERYKQIKRSPPSSSNRTATNSTFGSSPSVNVHQGSLTPASRPSAESRRPVNNPAPPSRTHPATANQQAPPMPAQRSTSPLRNSGNNPLQSTGSTTEWTSTNFDSDEDEESEDEGQVDGVRYGFPQSSKPVPRPRNNTPSPRTPKIQNHPRDNLSDWESDEVSDLEELDLGPSGSGYRPQQSKPPVSQPKGQKVAQLSRSIEMQLGARKGQKPAGGVDTMKSQNSHSDLPGFKDDDSFPDVSSLEDQDGVAPVSRNNRHQSGRGSFADTDQSSNTLGTSKWGSSSRGGSSQGQGSVKDSVVSLTDWDSDFSDL